MTSAADLAIATAHKKKKHHKTVKPKLRRHRLHAPPGGVFAPSPTVMSQSFVDRLFWRTGFGPTAQDRATWIGQSVETAVDALLAKPQAPLVGPDPTNAGIALDPTGNDTDLVLSWLDVMVRTTTPLIERLSFFWHRHWANSRLSVSPPQLLMTQNGLFRSYADLAANPTASFHQMAYDLTENASMLRYLSGESNVKGAPNENYARELMELFCLGPVDAHGAANYSEDDVKQVAKAMTGWQINDANPDNVTVAFSSGRWYNGPKIIFGNFGNYKDRDAVDLILGRPAHAPYLLTKLWSEFIVSPPDAATLADLVATYTSSGMQLKPVLRKILTHPLLFESATEPNMIKPPVVFVVGVLRALGLGIADSSPADYLDEMGQVPYFPPTVAGWEGGDAWLNTNTALARFGFVANLIANPTTAPADVVGESPQAAIDRAAAAVGSPWLADGTKAALLDYSNRAPRSTAKQRISRQVVLRSLVLAGPDAQVM